MEGRQIYIFIIPPIAYINIIIVYVYNYLENNVKQGIQHQQPEISNLTNKITIKESDKFK